MIYKRIRRKISRNLLNIYGWKTNRKIVIFESDDWGSIRMPSRNVYNRFLNNGIPVDKSPYCKYDSLASEEDLNSLFETLLSFEDFKGSPPIFTANAVVANPDFDKIKASGFSEYYFESITDTFKKYPEHSNCINLWKRGIRKGIFLPQFHGREHLNVPFWLQLLRDKHPLFCFAFENNCWGLSRDVYPALRKSIQASFDMDDMSEFTYQKKSITSGCNIFEDIFGYRSNSFIANNYIWDPKLNKTLYENGIEYLQGMKYQKLPLVNKKNRDMIRHYLGEKNVLNQYYLIRNCTFEPSQKKADFDNVGECIKDISNAFFWEKPAIIATHRLNYVGFLDSENRNRNLKLLDQLLNIIVQKWPEVEFLTSVQLGKIIKNDLQK